MLIHKFNTIWVVTHKHNSVELRDFTQLTSYQLLVKIVGRRRFLVCSKPGRHSLQWLHWSRALGGEEMLNIPRFLHHNSKPLLKVSLLLRCSRKHRHSVSELLPTGLPQGNDNCSTLQKVGRVKTNEPRPAKQCQPTFSKKSELSIPWELQELSSYVTNKTHHYTIHMLCLK